MIAQQWAKAWQLARRNFPLQLAIVVICLAALIALVGPLLPVANPNTQNLAGNLSPPTLFQLGGSTHPLGTDYLGRDILSRIVWGARTSLLVGFLAVIVAAAIGVPIGIVAPYIGGWFDEAAMRVFDLILAVPTLLVAIAILTVFGGSYPVLILVLGLRSTVYYSRTLRSRVLVIREEQYIKAARALALPSWQIVLRHVLPNALSPILVLSTIFVGLMIIIESNLSFLGLTQVHISWGFMVAESLDYIATAWWGTAFPGLCIFLVVLSMNVVGDFLRDVLDPRLQPRLG